MADEDVDETVIKDEIINILVAGRDTVSPSSVHDWILLTAHTDCCDVDIRGILARYAPESNGQTSR
jgi:hypothetical protein